MASSYRRLPDGYTQLEYIRHKYAGRIDTGVTNKSNTKIIADFQIEESKYGFEAVIFGVNEGSSKIRAFLGTTNNFYTNGSSYTYSQVVDPFGRTQVTALPESGYDSTSTNNISIFSIGASHACELHITKLYSMQMYEGTTLVRDFVPAIRNTDNEIGLYDIVNGGFYLEDLDLPDTYQRVEYIESTGTQYINTGYTPVGATGFFINFMTHNEIGESNYGTVFGSSDGWNGTFQENGYLITTWTDSASRGNFVRNSSSAYMNCDPAIEKDSMLTIGYSNVTKTLVHNDDTYAVVNAATDDISGTYPVTICAMNAASTIQNYSQNLIYFFCLLENYQPVHTYIPCIRLSDSEPGLYDIIDGEFKTNAGTGDLLYGNAVDNSLVPGPQVTVIRQLTVEFGLIKDYPETSVYYEGDDDSGLTVIIDTFGAATNIRIDRTTGGEYLQIDSTKFRAIVGSDIQEYDHIEINTRRGQKSASIYRNGIKYNILNAVNSSPNWIHLDKGINTFTFAAASGINNLRVHISYNERFNGV